MNDEHVRVKIPADRKAPLAAIAGLIKGTVPFRQAFTLGFLDGAITTVIIFAILRGLNYV
jgi:hypothetical protein